MRNCAIIITGRGPRAGKTFARKIVEEETGLRGCSSSDFIYPTVAAQLGLSEAELREARKHNQDAYRADMVHAGNRMAGNGNPPGVAALKSGYRVIDGVRRVGELDECWRYCLDRCMAFLHIHINGGVRVIHDNTDSNGLRSRCVERGGVVIGPISNQDSRASAVRSAIKAWWSK